jgi:acetylornithine deacetylase/succinyl-diaminopimelate desuccinylase-like protein
MKKTAAESTLADLIAMPTISADTVANSMAIDYIENYLVQRGMYCTRAEFGGHSTLLASSRPDNQHEPIVLLSGHTDVVAGAEEQFHLEVEEDRLVGRGTFDMKFAIAGYMQLVDEIKDRLKEYNFAILIVSDEETTDIGSRGHVAAGLRPQICILPDSTAPNWDIESLAKGYWRFDLIAEGRAAHGGRPWEGESASLKLIQALHELKTHFEDQHIASDSLNIGKIHGGEAHNMVCAEMTASIDVRFMSEENMLSKRQLIEALCKKYDITMHEVTLAYPAITDLDNPLIKQYMDSVEKITGRRPGEFISCAGSDAPYFQQEGIHCILSCCEGGGHHTKNEWIGRKSFAQFVPILRDYLDETARN